MTQLLDKALQALRKLSPDAQDDIARLVLRLVTDDEQTVIDLTDEEDAAIAESQAAAARGEFTTDEEIKAIWAEHGL